MIHGLSFLEWINLFCSPQLKTMQQKNLKPCDPTLATISVACSKALELDLAEVLLDQITNCPYPYPYNSFLEACDAMVS